MSREHFVLRTILLLCGAAFIVAYIAIAVARWPYPYELEWMGGGVLLHVDRVLHGQSVYGPPSVRFIPFIYTPLYSYPSAAVAWVETGNCTRCGIRRRPGDPTVVHVRPRSRPASQRARW